MEGVSKWPWNQRASCWRLPYPFLIAAILWHFQGLYSLPTSLNYSLWWEQNNGYPFILLYFWVLNCDSFFHWLFNIFSHIFEKECVGHFLSLPTIEIAFLFLPVHVNNWMTTNDTLIKLCSFLLFWGEAFSVAEKTFAVVLIFVLACLHLYIGSAFSHYCN